MAFLGDGGDDMVMVEGTGRWWQPAADGHGGGGGGRTSLIGGGEGSGWRERKEENLTI